MKRKNLDIERKELGMPDANKIFTVSGVSVINNAIKNAEDNMPLYEETLIKLGFKQEYECNDYYFTFKIVDKKTNDQIILISNFSKQAKDGKYVVRLFDTVFFKCKTISEVRDVVRLASKHL